MTNWHLPCANSESVNGPRALRPIEELSNRYRLMKGLLLELTALLRIMESRGIEGCDQSIAFIDSALKSPAAPGLSQAPAER